MSLLASSFRIPAPVPRASIQDSNSKDLGESSSRVTKASLDERNLATGNFHFSILVGNYFFHDIIPLHTCFPTARSR